MTVTTFNPDAHVESTSVDGRAFNMISQVIWATIHDATDGTGSNDAQATSNSPRIQAGTTTNQWTQISRTFLLFDTSDLPDGDTIDSALVRFVAISAGDDIGSQSIGLITTTPASDTALVTDDYEQYGTTRQAADLTFAGITADSSTFNDFTLNSTGLGNISKTGITKFGINIVSDIDDAEPSWRSNDDTNLNYAFAEEALSGDKKPRLEVTHTTPFTFQVGIEGMSGSTQPVQMPIAVTAY